jgi:broad specificity phosphatase PhoE
MKPATRLVLIRHGEVESRYQRVFGGRIDMGLSPAGHQQAAALAAWLAEVPLDAIYASPLRRVQQTLAPLVNAHRPPPVVLPGLREVDFGAWTGLGWEEVRTRFGVSAFDWLNQLDRDAIAEAEPCAQFRARVEDSLRQVLADGTGRVVAVVCHGGVIRMLLAQLLDLPLPRTVAFEIDYASVTVVDWRPDRVEIQLLNFVPWRPAAQAFARLSK